MLITQSIFEELQSETKSFPTYKELLDNVGRIWQKHVGVLPVEIGPKDIVELAVLRQWIQQDENGSIRIAIPKGTRRSAPLPAGLHSSVEQGIAPENGRVRASHGISNTATRGATVGHWPTRSQTAKARASSGQ